MKFYEVAVWSIVGFTCWSNFSPHIPRLLNTKSVDGDTLKTVFIRETKEQFSPRTTTAPAPVNPNIIDMSTDDLPAGTVLEIQKQGKIYRWNSRYQDSNGNRTVDSGDAGYFPPASTIKVAIAALAVEKNGGIGGIEEDLKLALVVSDNAASNRLIDKAGGLGAITQSLKAKGFRRFIIARRFGTPPQGKGVCQEGQGVGNCASASDLIRSLREIQRGNAFKIAPHDRQFLQKVMRFTPADLGIKKPNDYCRFLPGIDQQKCGVAIASRNYSGLGIVNGAYVFISVAPPQGTTDAQIIRGIHRIVNKQLSRIK